MKVTKVEKNEERVDSAAIASNWPVVELGTVCEVQLGKMLSPKSKVGTRPIPYLRNENVQWARFALDDVSWMDFSETEEEKFRLQSGDLLVCEGGEPGRCAIWQGQIERCCYQKALHRIRPHAGKLHPPFILYRLWLSSLAYELTGSQTKTTIAHLPREKLVQLEIPLPPLSEQERIAGLLGEQLAAVDQARSAARERLAAAQALPAAYLNKEFEGLLSDRNLVIKPFGELVTSYRNGFGRRPATGEGGTIVLRLADVSGGVVNLDDPRRGVLSNEEIETYSAVPGDLLFVRVNGSSQIVGRCIVVPELPEPIAFNDHLIRVRLHPEIDPSFVRAYMGTRIIRERIVEAASTSAGQLTINQDAISSIPIPAIKLHAQRRIAAELSEKLSGVDRLIASLQAERDAIEALPASLLREAFGGGGGDE